MMFVISFIASTMLMICSSANSRKQGAGIIICTLFFVCHMDSREYEVLKLLLENRGNTLSRDKILEIIWDMDGDFVEDNTLSVTVKRLRKKLKDYSYVVETVRGIGYRFVGD